tara:strand:- start:72 stop:749 length:678 start_codon:yes stop_codon:yes gene_type:complete
MKKKNIYNFNYLDTPNAIFKKKKFILSALNLAFLAYFFDNQIKYNKNYVLWPDGIFSKIYINSQKIPGFELINKIKVPLYIKQILVLGNLESKEFKYLKKKFNRKILHSKLEHGSIKRIIKNNKFLLNNKTLCLITLPTPKQEQLSNYLSKVNKTYKVICIGGGLSIASKSIAKCPKIISLIGFEWLWRLKTDTYRRIKRLVFTFFVYLFRVSFSKRENLTFNKI